MAALRSRCCFSARLARISLQRQPRGFSHNARAQVAQNFVMPAMSPTMTEGNIATWKLKEGDSFSAGDVLLEIETDKAQMDVEAQEDGVLAKIIQTDGTKSVRVGSRIAILAEIGDDLQDIEMPEEDHIELSSEPANASASAGSAPSSDSTQMQVPEPTSSRSTSPRHQALGYPLYPAVEHLLHTNGLSAHEVPKIPASGPQGRLLKGDVLAYLGQIDKSYPADQSKRISKLSHLNLTNIKIAKTPSKGVDEKLQSSPSAKEPAATRTSELALPVSLSSVTATQTRVQESLGIFLPLSTFIARASDLANSDLPASNRPPTSDDLFNSILGLEEKTGKPSRGTFVPILKSMLPGGVMTRKHTEAQKTDIIDYLIGSTAKTLSAAKSSARQVTASSSGVQNIFSVMVPEGDEARAKVYLERMKTLLEVDTGRLVL